jgi:hypothetical protein
MATFAQHDVVPAIVRRAAGVLDRREPRDALVELHSDLEIAKLLGRRLAEDPHRVLAFDDRRRAREAKRELSVSREDDQARAIGIERADVDPASVARARQLEQRLRILAVVRRARLGVLVVREMLMLRACLLGRQLDRPAIDADPLASADLIAQLRDSAVDRDAAVDDPALDGSARAETRIREGLLNSFGQRSSPAL